MNRFGNILLLRDFILKRRTTIWITFVMFIICGKSLNNLIVSRNLTTTENYRFICLSDLCIRIISPTLLRKYSCSRSRYFWLSHNGSSNIKSFLQETKSINYSSTYKENFVTFDFAINVTLCNNLVFINCHPM